jgi:hypothetical protein
MPNMSFEYAFARDRAIASRVRDSERFVEEYHSGVCADLNVTFVEVAVLECIPSPRGLPIERLHRLRWESQAEALRSLCAGIFGGAA